jgi:hypothetical protein
MSIEKNILRILEEINESQKSILKSIVLNEEIAFSSPLNRKLTVTSGFGPRWGTKHIGVDLLANAENVRSPADGIVIYTASDEYPCGGTIKIKHSGGYQTGYCHMMKIDVKAGQLVKQGDIIGVSGGGPNDPGKGKTQGRHLHFTLRKNDEPVDPMKFLDKDSSEIGFDSSSDSDFTSSKVIGSPSTKDDFDSLSSFDNNPDSVTSNSIIDDLYSNQDDIEYGGLKKNVKENIERIKKIL